MSKMVSSGLEMGDYEPKTGNFQLNNTACPVRLFPCSHVNFWHLNGSNFKINQIFEKSQT